MPVQLQRQAVKTKANRSNPKCGVFFFFKQKTAYEIEILTSLNRDYIRSVQNGDVRRFDEILASDFRCSHPDGSLLDRRRFLAQTARPVSISNLAAHDVEISLSRDVAIIHARTSYTM